MLRSPMEKCVFTSLSNIVSDYIIKNLQCGVSSLFFVSVFFDPMHSKISRRSQSNMSNSNLKFLRTEACGPNTFQGPRKRVSVEPGVENCRFQGSLHSSAVPSASLSQKYICPKFKNITAKIIPKSSITRKFPGMQRPLTETPRFRKQNK